MPQLSIIRRKSNPFYMRSKKGESRDKWIKEERLQAYITDDQMYEVIKTIVNLGVEYQIQITK